MRIDSEKTRLGLKLFRELRHELFDNGKPAPPMPFQFERGKLAFLVDARQAVCRLQQTGMKEVGGRAAASHSRRMRSLHAGD
ncbi:MAG: hypothetical protein L6W00_22125 [Lentisphaeria bacterium]|nr:MAG: hypothetical protein L6W00_22125 [Lentisphaeria bacterium]